VRNVRNPTGPTHHDPRRRINNIRNEQEQQQLGNFLNATSLKTQKGKKKDKRRVERLGVYFVSDFHVVIHEQVKYQECILERVPPPFGLLAHT
jgi:hypothetical protein